MSSHRYNLREGGFEVTSLPGNLQVAICHAFYIAPRHRGGGAGKKLKSYQNDFLKVMGYDYAVCTVRTDNIKQRNVLQSQGWKRIYGFYDHRQDVVVELWSHKLVRAGEENG